MGKNKKRPNRQNVNPQGAQGVSPQDLVKQQDAVKRLATMMQAMSAPPEPILSLFERLGIPYEVVENVPEDQKYTTVVINLMDLIAGEERNQAEGSLLTRMYGKSDPVSLIPENPSTGGHLPPNTHNPQTGVKLPPNPLARERLSADAVVKGAAGGSHRPSFQDLLNKAVEKASEEKGATDYSPNEPHIETKPYVAPTISDDEDDDYLKGIQG